MPTAQDLHSSGTPVSTKSSRVYTTSQPPSFKAFTSLLDQTVERSDYPLCTSVDKNVPVYDLNHYPPSDAEITTSLQEEWYHILRSGPGVIILKNFLPQLDTIKATNVVFDEIIAAEASHARGDHFAASGKNSRIWNSFQKHAERDPPSFVQYYSNPWLSIVSEAWLGPGYQVTAQVNIVRPGGSPQVCHRDYHLGFQTAESCSRYPKAMQVASQYLTLQGAIAHSQVPLESGPTRFLPFSQQFEEGFMAYRLPEFQAYFNENWVSCAMAEGDACFFNPALFHAAGQNNTNDVHRSANLLQISSAFGKTMETIDTGKIVERCWDRISEIYRSTGLTQEVQTLVKAVASGYPFPTNLDRRPPAPGGMAPESEADIVLRGLEQGWSKQEAINALQQYEADTAA